jgi:hypothetical protein
VLAFYEPPFRGSEPTEPSTEALQSEPNQTGGEDTLRAIVDGSVSLVPGTRWAGISMIQGRSVSAEVPTDPLVAVLDELQTALDEGPCISALREHHTVHIEDMATETRWPRFARVASDRGVRTMLSFNCSSSARIWAR